MNATITTPKRSTSVEMAVQQILARVEYLTALRTLDWQHEFSDCAATYRRGRQLLLRIRELQPLVDPDAALFNAHRPGRHGDATL